MKLFLLIFVVLQLPQAHAFDGLFQSSGRPGAPQNLVETQFTAASSLREMGLKSKFLVMDAGKNKIFLAGAYRSLQLNQGPAADMRLWTPELGLAYSHELGERKAWGLLSRLSSPSNHPFQSTADLIVGATFFYQMPSAQHSSWMFFLNYETHRSYASGHPLPGLGYMASNESKTFNALLGVPFFLMWQFADKWMFQTSLLVPALVKAEITTFLWMPLKLRTGFQWDLRNFLIHDRPVKEDQLFYDQKSVYLAARMPLLKYLAVELRGAYLWDRRSFVAEGIFKRHKESMSTFKRGWSGTATLSSAF